MNRIGEGMMSAEAEVIHQLIVDRLEDSLAVVEIDGDRFVTIPRWLLPAEAREDDILAVTSRPGADGVLVHEVRIDRVATAEARREGEAVVDRLRRRDPGGDLAL